MHLTLIAAARPNFMKIAPIIHAISKEQQKGAQLDYRLVHTGQHYDKVMSDTFFEELGIPEPHVNLGCGGGTQAEQTAAIMVAFEKYIVDNPTDLVMVVGDVTSTMACSIVAKKQNIKVAHVEAGIRSWDLSMPEEINRMVTDSITDYFFTTTELASKNLRNTGIPDERVFLVGNVMIDTLLKHQPRFRPPAIWEDLNLQKGAYFVLTMHRPANVDQADKLKTFLETIDQNVEGLPVVFPAHHRTRKVLEGLSLYTSHLYFIDPLGYLDFNYLVQNAKAVLTDSGGITEETTVMGIPCLTLRDNTERPETVEIGTNELIGTDPKKIAPAMEKILRGDWKEGAIPEKWDGKASSRIIEVIMSLPNE